MSSLPRHMTKPTSSSRGDGVLVSAFMASTAALVAGGTYMMMRSERTRSLRKLRNSDIATRDMNTTFDTLMEDMQYKTDISTGESEETPDISIEDFSSVVENNDLVLFAFLDDNKKIMENDENAEMPNSSLLQTDGDNMRDMTNANDSNFDSGEVINDEKSQSNNEAVEAVCSTAHLQSDGNDSTPQNGASSSSTKVVLTDLSNIQEDLNHVAVDKESSVVVDLAETGDEHEGDSDNLPSLVNETNEQNEVQDSSSALDACSKETVDEFPNHSSSTSSEDVEISNNVTLSIQPIKGKDDMIFN
jgi:hypothetical protein